MATTVIAMRSVVPLDPKSYLSGAATTNTSTGLSVAFGNGGCNNRLSLGRPLFHADKKSRLRKVQCQQQETSTPSTAVIDIPSITRKDFPPDFIFGASTSSAQIEGAHAEGGKALSIWDIFSHLPGKIAEGGILDVSCDHYHKYKDDVKLMKQIGLDSYRFSISWSRILPDGVNQNPEGIKFYNNLINELLQAGITPFVTIFHYDIPHALDSHSELKGWRGDGIVDKYAHYAETCFKLFGDRVKFWITHNEPHIFSLFGYGTGVAAPGRCSPISGGNCEAGDSSTEPYIVCHNLLKAHAKASKIYKTKYQSHQKGKIGITVDASWYEPYSKSKEDQDAAQRYLEFENAWQIDPLFTGDYPKSMRERVGNRLPRFTKQESEDLKRSCDFLGINYYTSGYVKNDPEEVEPSEKWFETDIGATRTGSEDLKRSCDFLGINYYTSGYVKNDPEEVEPSEKWFETDIGATRTDTNALGESVGAVMGPPTIPWLRNAPWGLNNLLKWLKNRCGDIPLYITENGCMDPHSKEPVAEILNDMGRITYISQHLKSAADAVKNDHVNLKGYFVWSLMDNFEWASGYTGRFGLIHCDFDNGQTRTLKSSAKWYNSFLATKNDGNHGSHGHKTPPPPQPHGGHGHPSPRHGNHN